ncbi:hypothetical protein NHQ30_000762 [Ciborinia camelliae]|nr:hypothetical protein NHQ30_000762 [Ciborinia camelliae]
MSNEGYAKLAQTMARHDELGIFRRFRKLGLQNLLYLQAELTYLEKDLENLAQRDTCHQSRVEHSKDWYSLAQGYDQAEDNVEGKVQDGVQTNRAKDYNGKQDINGSKEDDKTKAEDDIEIDGNDNRGKNVEEEDEEEEIDEEREQWEKALQIREKLREYYEHLNQQIFINNLPQPREHDLNFLRKWFERPKLGNYPLSSRDKDSWSGGYEEDLLALQRKPTSDPFSRWIIWSCVPYLHRKFLKYFKRPVSKEGDFELPQPQARSTKPGRDTKSRTNIFKWFSRGTEKEATRGSTINLNQNLVAGSGDNATISQAVITCSTLNGATDMVSKDVDKALNQKFSHGDDSDLEDFDGSQIYLYEDKRIVKAVNVLSIVFASMMPITSILVLYFVSNTLNRLAIAVVFEGLFAFALAMTTRASRGEIFAATSA